MISIPGQKLALRDFQIDDLDSFAYWLQPQQQWQKLDAPYEKSLSSPEEITRGIDQLRNKIQAADWLTPRRRLVVSDRKNNSFIGFVSWYWISEETNWAAAGIVICDPTYWRRGFGYEALGLWCDYLFQNEPEWVRLDLRTWSGNIGMMRLAAKLGFKEEARFRNARIVAGEYYDSVGYGILREEWKTAYPNGFGK